MTTTCIRRGIVLLVAGVTMLAAARAIGGEWRVVVNNGDTVPGDNRKFNSYNPPSLSVSQIVVFRARSRGGMMGQPAHGVFTRDMLSGGPVIKVFDRNTFVPDPNNLDTTFTEPPSFPRIDMWWDTVASRGNHQPVWRYFLPSGLETRAGTTGIYTNPFGSLITGASNMGEALEFPFFAVPGGDGARFDVFPGAPAVAARATIVFKGNYTLTLPEGDESRTGVYYRDLGDAPIGGDAPAVLIANNDQTMIPGTDRAFGSTAPPSAAVGPPPAYDQLFAVFAGFDNEEAPTAGGIYLAQLDGPSPPLEPLVEIGSQVPGEEMGTGFNRLGEGVSFDGRFVGFWGAWGMDERHLILQCPEEGNQDRIDYCQDEYGGGFPVSVPVHQGIFVHDIRTGETRSVAKAPNDFDDFLFWNFSGRVPGTGEGDDAGELARWRSAAFLAVSGLVNWEHVDPNCHVAFKARTGLFDSEAGEYLVPIDGIYLRGVPGRRPIETLVETGMNGTLIDPEAFDPEAGGPDTAWLPVTEMGIERDGFRGDSIAVNVSMGTEEAGWAGIYLTEVRK